MASLAIEPSGLSATLYCLPGKSGLAAWGSSRVSSRNPALIWGVASASTLTMAWVLTTAPSLWPINWRSIGSSAGTLLASWRIIFARIGPCFAASPGVLLWATQL